MVITILSWIIIGGMSYILGDALVCIIAPNVYRKAARTDLNIVCGLMVLNVYAEICSIFIKVGCIAFLIAFAGAFIWAVYGQRYKRWNLKQSLKEIKQWQICVCIIVVSYIGLWTLRSPSFIDTYIYHAQAIRWIEEYGVVPGLGNLHNRFAYNSAFLPLQALFSFSWLLDSSLHSLNGFLCVFFLFYFVFTCGFLNGNWGGVSDYLKLIIPLYIYLNRYSISSPGTDMLAMLLVIYIPAKWCECFVNGESDIQVFGVISLIAGWAITVKLSTITSIIFAVYVATKLIKAKRWRLLLIDFAAGIIILFPWLIRNLIISGYLIYPYSGIDLFNFDWKMPQALVDYDRQEIMVWGRGIYDVTKYKMSISQWLPIWYADQKFRDRIMIIVGLVTTIILILFVIINIIRKIKNSTLERKDNKNTSLLLTVVYSILGTLFWLFSAPLIRYGMVYLIMPLAIFIYILKERIGGDKFMRSMIMAGTFVICIHYLYKNEDFRLIKPQGYWFMDTEKREWEGIDVYIPTGVTGDVLTGYDDFPGVPKEDILEKNERRGDKMESGFRPKAK